MGKIIQNYSLQALIGEGIYGKVYRGINLKTKQQVAIKVIKAQKFRQIPKLQQCTVNQINILSCIQSNQHIVTYIDMLKTVNNFYFVYEYCNGGTLEKLMQTYKSGSQGAMPESQVLIYFKQILKAFKTLTKYNIMHRDLKPGNILLNNGIIKIADFGFCKSLNSPEDLVQTMLGSPIYMAPEVLKGENYTMKAEIWSLGVVLCEMLTGQCPYQSNSIAKLIQILDTQELNLSKPIHPTFDKLLKKMLVKDQFKRIDWVDLFEFKLPDISELDAKKSYPNSVTKISIGSDSANYIPRQNFMKSKNTGEDRLSGWTKDSNTNSNTNSNSNSNSNSRTAINRRSPARTQYTNNLTAPSLKLSNNNPSRTYVSKSPYAQSDNFQYNISNYINTHKKSVQLNKLSIDVAKKQFPEAIALSYLLVKGVQGQLFEIISSINKQVEKKSVSSQSISQYNQMKKTIQLETDLIATLSKLYKSELQKSLDVNKLFTTIGTSNKNKYIKSYIKALNVDKQQSIENLVHASQILDYFEDGILLKKEYYQRLSKEQLHRQIMGKMVKLQ